ncbi:MAG: Holliday junction resolvase RuvX [Planctomycetes bacterium]|nr:Holliday junction resolvase RuvX [Planctomycetota bacterium]
MGRLLGIDYGVKRFGLALSDATQTLASPLEVIEGESALWSRLEELRAQEDIQGFVLGLPRNMDGSLGKKGEEVLAFKNRLEARSDLPVATWDERLTTVEAERSLKAAGLSRGQRRSRVDKVAAQILLQSYLDCRKRRS